MTTELTPSFANFTDIAQALAPGAGVPGFTTRAKTWSTSPHYAPPNVVLNPSHPDSGDDLHFRGSEPDQLDSVVNVLEINKWLQGADWLDATLQQLKQPAGLFDTTAQHADDLLGFLRTFGDIGIGKPPSRGVVEIRGRDLVANLANLRLAALTAFAVAKDRTDLHERAVALWATNWPPVFLPSLPSPGFAKQPSLNEARRALARWITQLPVRLDFTSPSDSGPAEPVIHPRTALAHAVLTYAAIAKAIKLPPGMAFLHICAECETMFEGDRRRKQGGTMQVFCGKKCRDRSSQKAARARRGEAEAAETSKSDRSGR